MEDWKYFKMLCKKYRKKQITKEEFMTGWHVLQYEKPIWNLEIAKDEALKKARKAYAEGNVLEYREAIRIAQDITDKINLIKRGVMT